MKCYCYETETDFCLCVKDVENTQLENAIQHAWFEKIDNGFIKVYPMKGMDNGVTEEDKEIIIRNFARLGPSMFEGMLNCDWERALLTFTQKCKDNDIEWNVFGSLSEKIIGVDIKPHDIDIFVHTRDFFKVKNIFKSCVVEPFVDNKGEWLVRYFGRLCIDGVLFDIAAEDRLNRENHKYDKVLWNGYDIYVEPLKIRYSLEIQRKRKDRLKAMELYMKANGITYTNR